MRLRDKVAIVTGASGGIGAATARLFAEQGAKVVLTDLEDGSALAAEIGGQFVTHNVTDQDQWRQIAQDTERDLGKINILVNAAGIEGNLADGSPLGSFEEWRRVISVNLDGTFLGVNSVLPIMLKQGTGSIINVSSLVTFNSTPFSMPYGASKAGVWHLSKSVAAFAAQQGTKVRCNSVHPGLIHTRMTDTILSAISGQMGVSTEEAERAALRSIPFGQRGRPEDVANLMVYLASDESEYVTGSEFKVDGGWSLGVLS